MSLDLFFYVVSTIFLVYAIILIFGYLLIGFYSIGELQKYLLKNSFTNYRLLASSPEAPPISIIAPAYNEAANIIENARSLLSIFYNSLEVIIVNDGSKDNSMELLTNAYDLYKTNFFVNEQIKTKEVRGVYKSRNPIYNKLVVVDKVNGGKADALNVGINVSSHNYIVCIDVDCILEQDSILKLVKPFLETRNKRVIAAGGVVRIVNGCEVAEGRLVNVRLPAQLLPRMQTLEYIRAFLLGRMAWSRLGGLMLISGAFGAFDKEIVIKCGGYDHGTVGEDMELLVRMRRYMEEQRLPYRVAFIPDPLCWTEAPATSEILDRQRNRWARGTIETLYKHRVMFMNPKYGVIGMLSFPYWFFFEMMAPLVEFGGIIYFTVCAIFGLVDYTYFLSLLLFIYTFGVLYSVFAILMEVRSYNQYTTRKDMARLIGTAFMEPFVTHPLGVWAAVRGTIDLLRKKNSWGEMTRAGFHKKETTPGGNSNPAATPVPAPVVVRKTGIEESGKVFSAAALVWLLILITLSIAEFAFYVSQGNANEALLKFISYRVWNDLVFFTKSLIFLFVPFIAIQFFSFRFSKIFLFSCVVLLSLLQAGLIIYYHKAGLLLGSDIFGYSQVEINQTLGSSGVLSLTTFLGVVVFLTLIIIVLHYGSRLIRLPGLVTIILTIVSLWSIFSGVIEVSPATGLKSDFENLMVLNKSDYFFNSGFQYVSGADDEILASFDLGKENTVFQYVDPEQYPFLHKDLNRDVLSSRFNVKESPPNVVILLLEGLGSAYSNDRAYLGSFTPFLDSLSRQSLYWENFLSQGGRTFAVLPAVLGSLPFGSNGFAGLNPLPQHLSLISLLKHNGYHTSFYYGGDASFDGMQGFLQNQGIDQIIEEKSFPKGYQKLPVFKNFTWGYGDKELFRYFHTLADTNIEQKPNLNVFLTVSSHNSFKINDQPTYEAIFENRLIQLRFNEEKKSIYRQYKDQYSSILYMDDAVKEFMTEYRKRPDFENTIFILTGDHRMPEIPMTTKIDRYHVPMMIYSPMLKGVARFSSISSHNDITPSLLSYLKNSYAMQLPEFNTWLGEGLDTLAGFHRNRFFPIMQSKTENRDFVLGNYHLNGSDLFRIYDGMDEEKVVNAKVKTRILEKAAAFKRRNRLMKPGSKLVPDSIYKKYTAKGNKTRTSS
ncbi:sulfatase-like hydrolase/transferase [Daejeonella sp.]|uniref:sulfatase-like hydrolase/transferase n=1 Tax=Daejeonella sp. TaxID=2805397 RepID=UPI0039830CAE